MNEITSFFQENGYYHAKGVFSKDEITELEAEFDRIVAQINHAEGEDTNARWQGEEMKRLDGGQSLIFHTHNVQQYSAKWHLAMLHPKFLEVTRAILGDNVVLHHSKLFQKPPEKGSPFPMHQDWTYFPTVKDTMMAGIIHVSDATDEMGCLRVYPTSHKLGRIENTSGQHHSDVLEKYPIENATIVEAEAGDVVFFSYFTMHGSMPNRSQNPRKTVLIQMYAGDDHAESPDHHPDEHLVLSGWNYHATRFKTGNIK